MNPADSYIYYKHETFPSLPFDIKLSLDRIFTYWEDKVKNGSPTEKIHAKAILDSVKDMPELRAPIGEIATIERFGKEINQLLSAIFPEILTNNEIKAASLPFFSVLFNMSNRLKSILSNAGDDFQLALKGFDHEEIYILACSFLIGVYYKVPINFKRPVFFDIPDKKKGITRHYRVMINGEFSSIRPKENFTPLSPEDIQFLIDNSRDIQLWKKMIPPGSYDFEGIAIVTLYDQTEDEALSELKQLLLESDALHNQKTIDRLQVELAQFLGVENVEIGFEAYSEMSGEIRALHAAAHPSKLLGDYNECEIDDCFCDDSFEALIERKESFAISNVKELKNAPSPFIKRMFDKDVGSFIVSPLKVDDQIIAFIELTSPNQGVLNSMVASKLRFVLPMFTVAVSRSIRQHETELEAIVQDRFTSIHPSVSWKFTAAAEKIHKNQRSGIKSEPEDIRFGDVYPFYGQFDIRGSSDARNNAIQSDILTQLNLACDLLQHSLKEVHMPITQQVLFRLHQYRDTITHSIKEGDEVKILNFLKQEFDPLLVFVEKIESMAPFVKRYKSALHPTLGLVYDKRKVYENTVTMVNEQIANYIEQQQVFAQRMFPHYFEKYKTDGVEYNAYIGQSLLQSGEFFPLHLKNLRLWQLIMTAGVENMHHANKAELPMPLDITSLILVHSSPHAIRFRMDEKRFDVDGAYNARYEILKKRIDKAYIRGTQERLTQPGKLAIVYSQDWEADEYLQYIQYLQSINYLENKIEKLELEELQGASGLQAFRVGFMYEVTPEALIKELMQESNA